MEVGDTGRVAELGVRGKIGVQPPGLRRLRGQFSVTLQIVFAFEHGTAFLFEIIPKSWSALELVLVGRPFVESKFVDFGGCLFYIFLMVALQEILGDGLGIAFVLSPVRVFGFGFLVRREFGHVSLVFAFVRRLC